VISVDNPARWARKNALPAVEAKDTFIYRALWGPRTRVARLQRVLRSALIAPLEGIVPADHWALTWPHPGLATAAAQLARLARHVATGPAPFGEFATPNQKLF
jgi:hypothetical protein